MEKNTRLAWVKSFLHTKPALLLDMQNLSFHISPEAKKGKVTITHEREFIQCIF